MEIKITPKKTEQNSEDREKKIRILFGNDLNDKGGIIAKCFIFLYLNQPCSVNELKEKVCRHYEEHFERTKIIRVLDKLKIFNLIGETTPSELQFGLNPETNEILYNGILAKYNKFLQGLPKQFQKNFGNMSYFWVTNGEGVKYLPYCSKLLDFECNVQDKPMEEKSDYFQTKEMRQ